MRYLGLVGLIVSVMGFCFWQQTKQPAPPQKLTKAAIRALKNTGATWNDSLLQKLPKNIDTSVIVYDNNGTALHFYQYVKPVFNNVAIIYQDRGVWKLHRLNDQAADSLKKDDYAVASRERWDAYTNADMDDADVKLSAIAHTLAQADHVLVIKHQRLLSISRKGKEVMRFRMNLGWAPVGRKQQDGDGKTPEGTYHLDQKYERSDKYYKSFLISYPNKTDKQLAKKNGVKPGFSILIHGTYAAKKKAKDWTAGCIALQNKDMDSLFNYIGSGTLIEIRK